MKKTLIILSSLILTSQAFSARIVYDPTNHRQNMQNYQMMILQKIEEVKTATENIIQTQQQLEQLQHDVTNLESWSGAILGEKNQELVNALKDLNTINENSKSILRNAQQIDSNFDRIYATRDRLAKMDNKELAKEMYRLSQNRNNNLKEHLKTATTILEQNEKENQSMANFMALTDGARGNLQSSLATKKGIDQLNNKIARMSELEAKKLIIEAENLAEEEARKQVIEEEAARMRKASKETEEWVKRQRAKKGIILADKLTAVFLCLKNYFYQLNNLHFKSFLYFK